MSDSILEAIRARRLRAAKASVSYCESRERAVSSKIEETKQIIAGKRGEERVDDPLWSLRNHYYRMKHEYSLKDSFSHPGKMNKRSQAMWTRVLVACQASGTDQESFMRAQFAWFHKAFGRAPDLNNLVTEAAIERAREFTGNSSRRVVGNGIEVKLSKADEFRYCEKMLRDMCRAQKLTREEFYTMFVLTGEFSFPEAFLKADPVYRKLVEGEHNDLRSSASNG